MTPDRARELLALRSTVPGLTGMRVIDVGSIREHMSAVEDDYVRAVWARLPGWTCYADALVRIAHGTTEPRACPQCGTVHHDDATFCAACTPPSL